MSVLPPRTTPNPWTVPAGRPVCGVVAGFLLVYWMVSPTLADPPRFTVHPQRPAATDEAQVENTSLVQPSHYDASGQTGGLSRREVLLGSLTIFVLAIFVGFEVITKVPPTLHTPLMSGSNAISGITIVGALIAAGAQQINVAAGLGLLAVIMATINVVGGFMVTHRMLEMFQKKR